MGKVSNLIIKYLFKVKFPKYWFIRLLKTNVHPGEDIDGHKLKKLKLFLR